MQVQRSLDAVEGERVKRRCEDVAAAERASKAAKRQAQPTAAAAVIAPAGWLAGQPVGVSEREVAQCAGGLRGALLALLHARPLSLAALRASLPSELLHASSADALLLALRPLAVLRAPGRYALRESARGEAAAVRAAAVAAAAAQARHAAGAPPCAVRQAPPPGGSPGAVVGPGSSSEALGGAGSDVTAPRSGPATAPLGPPPSLQGAPRRQPSQLWSVAGSDAGPGELVWPQQPVNADGCPASSDRKPSATPSAGPSTGPVKPPPPPPAHPLGHALGLGSDADRGAWVDALIGRIERESGDTSATSSSWRGGLKHATHAAECEDYRTAFQQLHAPHAALHALLARTEEADGEAQEDEEDEEDEEEGEDEDEAVRRRAWARAKRAYLAVYARLRALKAAVCAYEGHAERV